MLKRDVIKSFIQTHQMRISECKSFIEQEALYNRYLISLYEAGKITKEQLEKWS